MNRDCINLKERFGDRYRVKYEDSYYAERPEYRKEEAPWLMIIPCQNGHICPWGGSMVAACTRRRGPVARRLKDLPFAEAFQDGDDGVNVVFNVEHFEEVAEIMKPRRRYMVSEEEARRRAERIAKYRFQPAEKSPQTALECVSVPTVV